MAGIWAQILSFNIFSDIAKDFEGQISISLPAFLVRRPAITFRNMLTILGLINPTAPIVGRGCVGPVRVDKVPLRTIIEAQRCWIGKHAVGCVRSVTDE